MPIVYAGAASHAPGITAWSDAAPKAQLDRLTEAFGRIREGVKAANPDTVLLLTSEHWANFFLDHIGPFCVGRGATFMGPVEPWLKVDKAVIPGNPELATRLLEHCYAHGFEPNYAHEMKFDHGSMVPLSFILPKMDRPVVPIMFNTLASPRATPARCFQFGKTLRPFLDAQTARIAVIATGGLSHDPGEVNHGRIDSDFDREFLAAVAAGDGTRLARYSDADLLRAGAGTLELLAWICLAGIMGDTPAEIVAYESVTQWATGMGVVTYRQAA